MKNVSSRFFALTIALVCAALFTNAQTPAFKYTPGGSAVVVSNIDNSARWYQSVFGLTVKTKMDDPNGAYHIVILESPTMTMELLELKGSVPRSEALKGKAKDTEIQGHFKVFFTVADMNACLKHLKDLKVDVPQVWTDGETKKRNFLVRDPDGNLVQFFE
jgi:catechol 2,3-dioxygenase-like lactoylglutathione lyase family enzyme